MLAALSKSFVHLRRNPKIDVDLVYTQLSKALLVPFKAEFGPYEGEIARLSQDIRDEASLASKQAQKQENELQAQERSDAKRYREIMVKFNQKGKEEEKNRRLEINRRKFEKTKFETLNAFSTYDYQKTYRQIRKECIPGTSMWICESPEFHAWMSGALKTLWFTGRCKCIMTPIALATLKSKSVGSGKSISRFGFLSAFTAKFANAVQALV